ncbi:ribonuclease inhibitor [Sphingobacterium sp. arapr2]|nr:ribonuclease inhibitor [Sphingobacterium prati]
MGFVIIEGKHIADIPSFYAEINRVYMADENWKIGSLDGFDDLLYGGFGKLQDAKKHSIIWKDIDDSRAALGMTTTLAYYQEKLAANSPFNQAYFQQKLIDLQSGKGQTYFDIVAEIIQSHLKIEWIHKTI